jgi:5-methylcytosine-specific restriction endonuclease McrA
MIIISYHVSEKETANRCLKISAHMEKLARDRQQRIDEANMFYMSPEWRLVRDRVVREQGRICQECGREIKDDFDLTVDHTKPRSKFPELALDASNLRVLCRRCNSAKGATYNESNTILEIAN